MEKKFWLNQILKTMKVLDRKSRNELRSEDIESATACGDDGIELGAAAG